MIQFQSIVQRGNKSWTFFWSTTGATLYRVILYGRQIASTSELRINIRRQGYDDYPPPIEVVSDDELADSERYPPFLRIQWYNVAGVVGYRMDEFIDPNTFVRARPKETGAPVLTIVTPSLHDERTYTYRVVAIDSIEQESTDMEFVEFVATPPKLVETDLEIGWDKPSLSITITAAA